MDAYLNELLKKISYGKNLTEEEARYALNTAGNIEKITDIDNSDGFFLLALTFGLMAKGLASSEIMGLACSIQDNIGFIDIGISPEDIIDLSGTGGDRVKTLNVSTAASFVVASTGAYVAKQATRTYTGSSGSADVFSAIGLDIFSSNNVAEIRRCLIDNKIAAYYPPAFSASMKTRIDFLKKIKNIGLNYLTPWHLVSWIHSPIKMNQRLYGVMDDKYVKPVAEAFIRLGYQRGMVVHGKDGLDEISNIGPTTVCEIKNGDTLEYILNPEDLDIQRANATDIECHNKKDALKSFFDVLSGKECGPKRDIVAMNAGACFYILGKQPSIKDGVAFAKQQLSNGETWHCLKRFANHHGSALQH